VRVDRDLLNLNTAVVQSTTATASRISKDRAAFVCFCANSRVGINNNVRAIIAEYVSVVSNRGA